MYHLNYHRWFVWLIFLRYKNLTHSCVTVPCHEYGLGNGPHSLFCPTIKKFNLESVAPEMLKTKIHSFSSCLPSTLFGITTCLKVSGGIITIIGQQFFVFSLSQHARRSTDLKWTIRKLWTAISELWVAFPV